ncbi:MAG: malonyl-CoA decarboxylase family protein [Thermodesulfobacteriota bacterium]
MGTIAEALARRAVERETLGRIMNGYAELTKEERPVFFRLSQEEIEVRPEETEPLAAELSSAANDPDHWRQAVVRLREGLASPRLQLFRQFIGVPGGLKFLLDLRADILAAGRLPGAADFSPLDQDLVLLFEAWFHSGFLFLEEISLDSPYRQIEIIKNGDLVHPMTNIEEMVRRLGRDRRCFALYHRVMPGEPVVFIEVALTRGVVRSIHDIIGPEPAGSDTDGRRDTAVFYSINNTQNGLAGLGLGQLLIFQVVDFLKRVAPHIKNFCTLSPMPGFWRRYLRPLLEGRGQDFRLGPDELEKIFDKKTKSLLLREHTDRGGGAEDPFVKVLLSVFSTSHWAENGVLVNNLAKPLQRLGYIYLAEEKDRTGRPLDPVANFHLSNGATLSPANVNFGANWSAMGLERSLSLMANYVYSYGWRKQIQSSMAWLGGLLPGLARRKTDRPAR